MTESALDPALSRVCVVLFEPQDDINIGNTVRACKNFGVRDIRLVRPRRADPDRILISAPKARDVVDSLKRFDTLEDAIADCAVVMATTARQRKIKRLYLEPRSAARQLVDVARSGEHVALLFGREDSGLPNEAIDLCQAVITIPTDPNYSSLNLGQAVLLNVWEVHRLAQDVQEQAPATSLVADLDGPPLASADAISRLFEHAQRALTLVDFIKPSSQEHIGRTLREMFTRLNLDTREASIWRGIFSQIEWAVGESHRRGVEGRPPLELPSEEE